MIFTIKNMLGLIVSVICIPFTILAQSTDSLIYGNSIRDAIIPESAEIVNDLISITPNNKSLTWTTKGFDDYVLMVNLISTDKHHKDSIGKFYDTKRRDTWVTAYPEFLSRYRSDFSNTENDSIRLRQIFGFPPNKECKYVIEFFVKPEDIFRPCPDPEIDDSQCELCFPENADQNHIDWFNKNKLESYYKPSLYEQYPWTQLGYTYDWSPSNTEIGLSEFVIKNNSLVFVEAIYPLGEYLENRSID